MKKGKKTMERVNDELEALQLCKEYQCKLSFRKPFNGTPEHVVVSLNAWTQIAGKDLVEAVNRLVETYHTAPINREQLSWWKEQEKYYL